jgi:hypothetical protein
MNMREHGRIFQGSAVAAPAAHQGKIDPKATTHSIHPLCIHEVSTLFSLRALAVDRNQFDGIWAKPIAQLML